MDRETKRLIEEYRRNEAGPLENNVIDELVGGSSTARSSSAARRCSGSAPARSARSCASWARPISRSARRSKGRRRHDPRRHPRVRRLARAVPPQRGAGSLAFAGIPGEYLTFTDPQGEVGPALATSWRPNADASRMDVPAPRGVRFHNGKAMTADGRRGELEAVRRRKGLERGPLPVLRRRGRLGARSVHGRRPAQGADRRLPVPAQPDDVPGDHPASCDRGQARAPGSRAA